MSLSIPSPCNSSRGWRGGSVAIQLNLDKLKLMILPPRGVDSYTMERIRWISPMFLFSFVNRRVVERLKTSTKYSIYTETNVPSRNVRDYASRSNMILLELHTHIYIYRIKHASSRSYLSTDITLQHVSATRKRFFAQRITQTFFSFSPISSQSYLNAVVKNITKARRFCKSIEREKYKLKQQ